MKKFLGLAFLLICSFSFFSCDDFWESVNSTTTQPTCILEEKVNTKTSYQSFTELNEPIILNISVFDAGINSKGSVLAIWDCEKDELFDWVYTPKTVNIWNNFGLAVEPETGKTMYLAGCYLYANYVLMDPAATELKDFPKTKSGALSKTANTIPKKPKYLAPVSPGQMNENIPHQVSYFSATDTANGNVKPSVGFLQDNITQDGYVLDQNGNYVFISAINDVYTLREFNPVTNTLTPSESEVFDQALPNHKIPASAFCINLFDDSITQDPDYDPTEALFTGASVTMNVLYADASYVIWTVVYGQMNPETELIDFHRNLAIAERSLMSTGCEITMTDVLTNNFPQGFTLINLDSLCNNSGKTECTNAIKIHGDYYLMFDKYVENADETITFSHAFEKINISAGTVIDTDIEIVTPYITELLIRGNRLYYSWEDDDYGLVFNYYDFETATKGEEHTLNGYNFNQ